MTSIRTAAYPRMKGRLASRSTLPTAAGSRCTARGKIRRQKRCPNLCMYMCVCVCVRVFSPSRRVCESGPATCPQCSCPQLGQIGWIVSCAVSVPLPIPGRELVVLVTIKVHHERGSEVRQYALAATPERKF